MISFKPTNDLTQAASFTLDNMRPYYAHYAVDWDQTQIEQMTRDLVNFDIVLQQYVVGVLRLSFYAEECWLRDLQVDRDYQNRGIGAIALAEAVRLAKHNCCPILKLRVFNISPAVNLYKREGFAVINDDERFCYMSRAIE
uniref:Acetyltransferase, GNAT family n=1 Tax=Rheinheimera sp. BAL341 TaxID=1708203 RepID=A0A486XNT0_9GAMM